MFSVIFPGQGSQMVGMGKEFYDKFDLVKNLFKEADDTLNFSMSKLILEGPKEELDLTAKYSTSNIFNQLFNL
jgi:[acyl-carrier-protein] S-malonyltransferase